MRTRFARVIVVLAIGALGVGGMPTVEARESAPGTGGASDRVLLTDSADKPAEPNDRSSAKRERYVTIDSQEFAAALVDETVGARDENPADDGTRETLGADSVTVELFDGERLTYEPIEAVQTRGPRGEVDSIQWLGQVIEPETGAPLGGAAFGIAFDLPGDPVGATMEYKGAQYRLRLDKDDTYRFIEVDNAESRVISAEDAERVAGDAVDADQVARAAVFPGTRTVRILVAYSNGHTSSISSWINQEIWDTNLAFAQAGSNVRVESAGIVHQNYDESGSLLTDLTRLRGTNEGYLDGLHGLRDSNDADLIALMVPTAPPGSQPRTILCGRGYIPGGVAGSASHAAFSVTALGNSACRNNHTFPHEVAHNFGAAHNPENVDNPGTFPSYSHGHYVVNRASTTMTYDYAVCPSSQPCPRQLQFSNPGKLLVNGSGAAAGTSTRDNERTIDQVSWAVKAYRPLPSTSTNDYLWRGTSGGGFSPAPLYNGQTSPHRPIRGDFDGDGRSDVFWYYPGSQAEEVFWFNSHTSKADGPLANHVSGSYRTASGDFDGDGKDDIFWYKPGTGDDYIWWGTSRANFGNVESLKSVNVSSYKPFAGDFDGDGKDDIFWYAPGGAQDYVWWGNTRSAFGTTNSAKSVSGNYAGTQPGNYDGDGEDDVFWYHPGSGAEYVWWGGTSRSNFGNVASAKTVNSTFELTSGDYNGDGDSELFFYAPGSGTDYVWNGQPSRSNFGPSSQSVQNVNGYYVATSGDTGNDGREDIYWFAHG